MRSDRPSWTVQPEFVTPETAQEWLDRTNKRNRKLSKDKVHRYARDMSSGLWQENGEAIIFSHTQILLDGQHRLEAIVQSGRSYWIIVVRNVNPNCFHTIDSGEARRPKDVLSIAGESYSDQLAPAANHHERYVSQRKRSGGSLTRPEMLAWLEKHPQLRKSAAFVDGIAGIKPVSVSMLVALHTIFAEKDSDQADSFVAKLISGLDLRTGDPVAMCRDALLRLRFQRGSIDPRDQMNYVIRAWNASREGEPLKELRLPRTNSDYAYYKAA